MVRAPVRLPATPIAEGATTFRGATLIDGEGGAPVPDAEIEVRDGVIAYAGPGRQGRDAPGSRVVDLTGTWVLPGFVDVHVHLAMVPDAAEQQRAWFPEEAVLAVAAQLRTTLEAGITTARDLDGLTPGYRLAVERGTAIGPRLHLAVAMLSPTGGHADPVLANGTLPAWALRAGMPESGVVDTDDDVVRAVRRLLRMGADAIKVSTSGGSGSPTDEPEDAGIPAEQVRLIRRLVEERGGRPITAHALTDAAARAAVVGGADSIEHGYDLSDTTIDLMLEHGTVLVPTLSTLMRDIGPRVGEERRRARESMRRRGMDSVRRAIAAGVPVALGTDAGVVPHGRNLVELAWLVEAGLTPSAAIHAGTMAGARVLGLADRIGSVTAGKVADLAITAGDPLESIGALGEPGAVRMVVQSGRVVTDLDRRVA
ncbi:amidohydrolase family protein [Microbacterium sp. AZCO]|uniref:amidohydrolase family protein n=1 Tax=Microbacterium sp. AZCO TaxID=3142976 RepID=UPI0031F384D9